MKRKRPMKYAALLRALEPKSVYTPATVVYYALEVQAWKIDPLSPASPQRQKTRVRQCLARFSKEHHFPFEGDGFIILEGQSPIRGWFGWRWQAALKNE